MVFGGFGKSLAAAFLREWSGYKMVEWLDEGGVAWWRGFEAGWLFASGSSRAAG